MIDSSRIEALKDCVIEAQSHIIGGRRVASADGAELDVLSPRDGKVLTTIAAGGEREIDAAVMAARASFDSGAWFARSHKHVTQSSFFGVLKEGPHVTSQRPCGSIHLGK